MPNLARKSYLQINTYKESCCSYLIPAPPCLLPHFSYFPAFLTQMPKCSKKTLSVQVCERENRERAPKLNWLKVTLTNGTNWSSKSFLLMRPLFFQFPLFSLIFPPHMQPVTFHLNFLLISIISINKLTKMSFFLSKPSTNFLSNNKSNEHPH